MQSLKIMTILFCPAGDKSYSSYNDSIIRSFGFWSYRIQRILLRQCPSKFPMWFIFACLSHFHPQEYWLFTHLSIIFHLFSFGHCGKHWSKYIFSYPLEYKLLAVFLPFILFIHPFVFWQFGILLYFSLLHHVLSFISHKTIPLYTSSV